MRNNRLSINRTGFRSTTIVGVLLSGLTLSSVAVANPDGPNVVAGNATIQSLGNELQITNSPGTIINWNGFSISSGELTRFLQQSGESAVLNRVTGSALSNIAGQLQSNGRVFLVNPNGIVIGNGARIDTAGFVGSSLDITDQDFASGNYRFAGETGSVTNNGTITAGPGGEVVLIAPSVQNNGDISVTDGEIILAAGREVVLTSLADTNISFRVSASGDSAVNLGSLIARSGAVGVFADQVVNRGEVSANRVGRDSDGRVVLFGDSGTEVSGNVSATGEGVNGGEIQILGDNIRLSRAMVNASGDSGGGQILIGGEFQGQGDLPRASRTLIDTGSVVSADATTRGNGGEVIVWSEMSTESFGRLTARGGLLGGDGGLVETSSRGSLEFGQPADVSAPDGAPGTWLLDPEDIVIDDARADSISTALNTGSNVQVKTADTGTGEGNITVAAPITKSAGGDAALGLVAHNRIDVNAPITSTAGKLSVSLRAGADISVNAGITTNGGSYSASIDPALAVGAPDTEEPASNENEGLESGVSEEGAADADDPIATTEAPEADAGIDDSGTDSNPDGGATDSEDAQADVSEEPANRIDVLADINTAGGDLSVDAGSAGRVTVESALSAVNETEDGIGGNVQLLGNQIGLFGDSSVDASGTSGGGEVLIGGGEQGLNPDVPNANMVTIGSASSVRADAMTQGDGGRVIIYAEDTTRVYGEVSARGGEQGGNGGFVETSGKKGFVLTKTPDISAPNGEGGTWLIDPDQIDIVESGTNTNINETFAGGETQFESTDNAILTESSVIAALTDGGNVRIVTNNNSSTGSGDINWLAETDLDGVRANSDGMGELGDLTLEAINDINITGSIYDSQRFGTSELDDRIGTLTLTADTDGNGVGDVVLDATSATANEFLLVSVRNGTTVRGNNLLIQGGSMTNQRATLEAGTLDVDVSGQFDILSGTTGSTTARVDAGSPGSTINADSLTINSGDPDDFNFGSLRFVDDQTFVGLEGPITIAGATTLTENSSISGSQTLTTGTLNMTAGDIRIQTLTLTDGDSVLAGDETNAIIVDNWNIEQNATVNWQDGNINLDGSTINNRGVFNAQGDDRLFSRDEVQSNAVFNNFGEFIKSGTDADEADDSTEIGNAFGDAPGGTFGEPGTFEFNNTGIVRAEVGDILFYQNALGGTPEGGFRQEGATALTAIGPGSISTELVRDSSLDPILPATFFFDQGSVSGGEPDSVSGESVAVINGNVEFGDVTVAPGNSPGALNINGNMVAGSDTTFEIELDGTEPGQADIINVTGTATLDGPSLPVEVNYTPQDGDLFNLITAASFTPGASANAEEQSVLPDGLFLDQGFDNFNTPNAFFITFFQEDEPVDPMDPPTGGGNPGTTPEPPLEPMDPFLPPPPTVTFDPDTPIDVIEPAPQGDPTNPDPVDSSDLIVTLLDQGGDDGAEEEGPEFLQCF